MKIVIVGFGTIGQRHCRLLKERGANVSVVTQQKDMDILSYASLEEALEKQQPDVVFICNETAKHADSLLTSLRFSNNLKVIVEKPLCNVLEEFLLNLSVQDQSRIFVSYNLRLSPLLLRLKAEISKEEILDATVNVGQNLSQWRKGDTKNYYSAYKSRGGGVLRDLSHELDYIQWIFSDVKSLVSRVEKVSNLTVDSEDLVHALLKTEKCPSLFLRLSYLDKDPIRLVRVNTSHSTYELNFVKGFLIKDGSVLLENHFISETYPMLADKILESDFTHFCTFQEALSVMKLILKLESQT